MTHSDAQSDTAPQLEAIILAAGKGTRMKSDLPKVLHPVAGRPMIHWVLDACEAVGVQRTIVIVGHQADRVRDELSERKNIEFVEQTEQLGTGHAVMQAEQNYFGTAYHNDVLVLCGDGPLIRPTTLQTLLDTHQQNNASATLATSVLDDPTGYGRIVRDPAGYFTRIVEHKDASEDEIVIREVNPSYYCFQANALFQALSCTSNENAKGEYYITDVFGIMTRSDQTVSVVEAVPAEDVMSINTPEQLAEVDQVLRARLGAAAAINSSLSEDAR